MAWDQDKELLAGGVVFLPWIGSAYSSGFRGRRLLVLGEAHYDWKTRQQEVPVLADLTRFLVAKALRERTWGFWGQIESACTGVSKSGNWAPSSFWNQAAFYNFIQGFPAEFVARARPSNRLFEAARKPFRRVIEVLRPGRILVCGARLWNGMEPIPKEDYRSYTIQAYRLSGGDAAWCMMTYHPSSGRFDPHKLTSKIWQFLDLPEKIPAD